MTDLNEINEHAIINVLFDQADTPMDIDQLDYLNLVFTRDGIFLVQKNRFGISFERIEQRYKNRMLRRYKFNWATESFLPKPDKTIFEDVLECFKYIVNQTKDELLIILYYDTIEKNYIMDIVKVQLISGGAVKYAYNKAYEMEDRYIKYLEIHSHNTMAPNFSGTDNGDEKKMLCFYGVIGQITEHSNVYSVGQKFRIWTGKEFREVKPWEVFDSYMKTTKIKEQHKDQMDEILRISKAAAELRKSLIPGVQSQFPGAGMHTLSSGKKIEVIEDNILPMVPNLFDTFFEAENFDDMDDDDLDESGIIWENYNDDEKEMLMELIEADNGRGVANVFNRPLPKN